mgnify:CR=1 FL=1
MNLQDANSGEIRSSNSVSVGDNTVFDHIVGQRLEEAVSAALSNVNKSSTADSTVYISLQALEDLYFLSFLDMTTLQPT